MKKFKKSWETHKRCSFARMLVFEGKIINFSIFHVIFCKFLRFCYFLGKTLAFWWPFRCLQNWRNSKKIKKILEKCRKSEAFSQKKFNLCWEKRLGVPPKRTFRSPGASHASVQPYFGIPTKKLGPRAIHRHLPVHAYWQKRPSLVSTESSSLII
jgi:hypothetical protein